MEPQTQASQGKMGNIILLVLLVVALVLGYFLYEKMKGPAVVPGIGKGIEATSGERAVLNYPAAGVSEEEWKNYLIAIAKVAVETDTITIGAGCSVKPVVLKTALVMGKTVKVKNTDSVPHTLSFNNPPNFLVAANSTTEMPVDFKGVPGIYGYGCDNSPQAVGLIQVLQ